MGNLPTRQIRVVGNYTLKYFFRFHLLAIYAPERVQNRGCKFTRNNLTHFSFV